MIQCLRHVKWGKARNHIIIVSDQRWLYEASKYSTVQPSTESKWSSSCNDLHSSFHLPSSKCREWVSRVWLHADNGRFCTCFRKQANRRKLIDCEVYKLPLHKVPLIQPALYHKILEILRFSPRSRSCREPHDLSLPSIRLIIFCSYLSISVFCSYRYGILYGWKYRPRGGQPTILLRQVLPHYRYSIIHPAIESARLSLPVSPNTWLAPVNDIDAQIERQRPAIYFTSQFDELA